MSTFSEEIHINAGPNAVWKILANIGTIADWNAGLTASHTTNDKIGVGATRHCVISNTQSLDEEVVDFVEDQAITFRIIRSTMPFKSADIRFTLTSIDEGTLVTVSPLYNLKYGFIGALMDRFFVQRMYSKGMRGLLDGLKAHVEAQVTSSSQLGEDQ